MALGDRDMTLHSSFAKKSLVAILFFIFVIALVLYKAVFISVATTLSSFWTVYGIIVSIFLVTRIPIAYLYEDDHDTSRLESLQNVSIIIPAKNEEAGIGRSIDTCLTSDYPGAVECIVVNDGSSDGTEREVFAARERHGADRVKLISFSENRGKREAMAAGVSLSKYGIIVFVDSDSFLAADGLRTIVSHLMHDPRIGAVSGNTKVENARANILTRIQSIQYAISYDIYKTCESVNRAVTCCPGCFSAYRRDAIAPFIDEWKEQRFLGKKGTFGDDRSLTTFLLREGWNVEYCEGARATTTVPESFAIYLKQQLRWKKSWIREGVIGGLSMWRRHPLVSLTFYIHFTFPFLGPLLMLQVLFFSIATQNPLLFLLFLLGFTVIGIIFGLFVHIHRSAEYWLYMPLFSFLFVGIMMWQMPYALLTVRETRWGTR